MRLHILGLLGALAINAVACGSEDGTPGPADPSGSAAGNKQPAAPAPPPFNPNLNGGGPAPTAPAPVAAPSGAPYPVILMHGMAGFGKLEVGPIQVTYFKDVVEDLTKNGESVYVTIAPPYATSEVRAAAIATQIDDILKHTGKAKVNLVGHSQGGMDARVLASVNGLNYGDKIATVTTVATPHRGSLVADAVMGVLQFLPASQVDDLTTAFLGVIEKTAYELQSDPQLRDQLNEISEKYMTETFNPKYIDNPNVVYKSYAGRSNLRTGILDCDGSTYANEPLKLDSAQGALLPTAVFLEQGQLIVNDGMVTVGSAKWGTFEKCVPADHLKEVGQLGPEAASFDHLQLFRDIVSRIRTAGF